MERIIVTDKFGAEHYLLQFVSCESDFYAILETKDKRIISIKIQELKIIK